jgi:hypothetical protein
MPDQVRFTYQCSHRGKDIADREGYLSINITDADRVKDERRRWVAETADGKRPGPSLGEMSHVPDRARWTAAARSA